MTQTSHNIEVRPVRGKDVYIVDGEERLRVSAGLDSMAKPQLTQWLIGKQCDAVQQACLDVLDELYDRDKPIDPLALRTMVQMRAKEYRRNAKNDTTAADRGSEVHEALALWLKGEPNKVEASKLNELQRHQYMSACEWMVKNGFKPVYVEEPIYHPLMGYAGTPDAIGFMDDKLTVLDFKTGKVWPSHKVQVTAYAEMHSAMKPGESCRHACILGLPRKLDQELVEHCNAYSPYYLEVFKACLTIHEFNQKEKSNGTGTA